MKDTDVIKRIEDFRKKASFSQTEFSNKAGIPVSSYSRLARCENKVTLEVVFNIIEVFDLNPKWILMGETEEEENTQTDKIGEISNLMDQKEKRISFLEQNLAASMSKIKTNESSLKQTREDLEVLKRDFRYSQTRKN